MTPDENRPEEKPERVVREVEVICAGGEDRPSVGDERISPPSERSGTLLNQMKASGVVGLGCLAALLMIAMVVVTTIVVGIPLAVARAIKGDSKGK